MRARLVASRITGLPRHYDFGAVVPLLSVSDFVRNLIGRDHPTPMCLESSIHLSSAREELWFGLASPCPVLTTKGDCWLIRWTIQSPPEMPETVQPGSIHRMDYTR